MIVETSRSTSVAATLNNYCELFNNTPQIFETACALILNKNLKPRECNALLDYGSLPSYVIAALYNKLNLDTFNTDIAVVGILLFAMPKFRA